VRIKDLINQDQVADPRKRYGVTLLEVFGSFTRADAQTDSDLDILVILQSGRQNRTRIRRVAARVGSLVRPLRGPVTRSSVERSVNKYFRRFVLRKTEPIYECV